MYLQIYVAEIYVKHVCHVSTNICMSEIILKHIHVLQIY